VELFPLVYLRDTRLQAENGALFGEACPTSGGRKNFYPHTGWIQSCSRNSRGLSLLFSENHQNINTVNTALREYRTHDLTESGALARVTLTNLTSNCRPGLLVEVICYAS